MQKIINQYTLFLFAHQDDEFGVFQKIIDEIAKGRNVYCAYFTTGAYEGDVAERRNLESVRVLSDLGVRLENIIFVGEMLTIPDGRLIDNLIKGRDWLFSWLETYEDVNIYLPAWEGGHHDHDSLHAIGVVVAKKLGIMHFIWQYPLYNAYKCPNPFFRVLSPLQLNGEVVNQSISFVNRLRFLRYIFWYPSQLKTWIGLFPFMLFNYVFSGKQKLQKISDVRIHQRPHEGNLYYERRNFSTWEKMSKEIKILQNEY
ncbi:PIG-L deacetylase family protein [Polynucleobacter sp. UB-Raua-W9]|uniref:PIG-L deacetylase family protein n=1 Tax=Polynucleobacter sp. UB-Raua-W9 TaxID=1819736 RepID=UPI001BFD560B|nr:PIG-L family deacetylase [Polynucleobacter sp. UB-Raua-W9]QWD72746.1 PIG-L family deacetylase [Polynucleobacter sp. UB-Raua-W9]